MFTIQLDYPTTSRNQPRYTNEHPNERIQRALAADHDKYRDMLLRFSKYFPKLAEIEAIDDPESGQPYYLNSFLPGLDCVALYSILAELNPRTYLEVGSGNSTKFARRSISDQNLDTRIISIDPNPRAEVDRLCDQVIRLPLEDVELTLFDDLKPNDVVFMDNSHRAFMNSDVSVCFLDIMPRLPSGVVLHLHDIFWPIDYPQEFADRYYNEQYLLGALIANGMPNYDVLLPNCYCSLNSDLVGLIEPLWSGRASLKDVERHGCSFWLRKR